MNKSTLEKILSNLKGVFSEHNCKYYYVDKFFEESMEDKFFEESMELVFVYPLPKKCVDYDLAIKMITGSNKPYNRLFGGLFLNNSKEDPPSGPSMKDRVYFNGGLINCSSNVSFGVRDSDLFSSNGKIYFNNSNPCFNYFFFSYGEEFSYNYYLNRNGIHCLERTVIQPYSYVFDSNTDEEEED